MKTLITDITVSNKIVWVTYKARNCQDYEGFTPYNTTEDAINHANKLMEYNVFDNDFYTNSKTKFLIK